VYLRQSTLKQLYEHRESTDRQYALRGRAIELGWREDQVEMIDEDLGQSGAGAGWRSGFQRLAEDVAQGRVGALFALELSRLTRSSADWHRLLELCGLADVVIVDEQAVYTPRDYNDQLLLGLKGQMSEAEQYWMRLRMEGGRLNKARRGELYFHPPSGYEWDAVRSRFRFDADERVQRAVRLVFERFGIDGSAYGIVRYFARHELLLPIRVPGQAPRRSTADWFVRLSAREGLALLQGLALCGRCGRRMSTRYRGMDRHGDYQCRAQANAGDVCFAVAATAIDETIAKLLLEAVNPVELELGLAVVHETERQVNEVEGQWKLRVERARYDARLAERRYKAVDPDNRVIARTLEREWEETLLALEALEREHDEVRRRVQLELGDQDRARILALARDLPAVWRASTTTQAERKNLLRMVITDVTLSPIDAPARMTRVQVRWETVP
jgi:DNA invertase Pin-like site-specific DNA recombinase